jgi:hypothetical protein
MHAASQQTLAALAAHDFSGASMGKNEWARWWAWALQMDLSSAQRRLVRLSELADGFPVLLGELAPSVHYLAGERALAAGGVRILLLAAEQGPDVLFCMPKRTKCILKG